MNDFKIILDETIMFTSKNQLYVMLIRTNNQHYIVIDDRCSRVGRVRITNSTNPIKQFYFILEKLERITCFNSCKSLVQLSFTNRAFVEARFIIHLVSSGQITLQTIRTLQSLYNFKTTIEFEDVSDDDNLLIKEVHVYFDTKRSIGKFTRRIGKDEFQFIFN